MASNFYHKFDQKLSLAYRFVSAISVVFVFKAFKDFSYVCFCFVVSCRITAGLIFLFRFIFKNTTRPVFGAFASIGALLWFFMIFIWFDWRFS